MKEENPRIIQIPAWMDRAVTELAQKNGRDPDREIAHLVEAALRDYGKGEAGCQGEKSVPRQEKPRTF